MFDLKIGFKCNNNCVHCVVADKRQSGSLDIPHIKSLIQKIPEGQIIQITGGEPSIYEYLDTILKICKKKNLETLIQSNGTGFSDKAFLEKCAPYIDWVHLAIHSCNEEVHDSIVQSKGMWKKTMEGLDNLLKYPHIKITTQTVLSTYNIKTLYDTFAFIQKKLPGVSMSMTYPHMEGNAYTNREQIGFRYIDYKDVIQKTLKDFHEFIFVEAIPFCYIHPYVNKLLGHAEKNIQESTSRVGIDFSSGFNIKNYNILDTKDKRKAPLCKKCIYNNQCLGVWKEYIDLYRNNLDLFPIIENVENKGLNEIC